MVKAMAQRAVRSVIAYTVVTVLIVLLVGLELCFIAMMVTGGILAVVVLREGLDTLDIVLAVVGIVTTILSAVLAVLLPIISVTGWRSKSNQRPPQAAT